MSKRYIKLYKELDEEQSALRSSAIRMPAGSEKNATHARSRTIKSALRKIEPLDEFQAWITIMEMQDRSNLSGLWVGTDYFCQGRAIAEDVYINHKGDSIVAVKITGDACVPAGNTTFVGSVKKGVDCNLGTPRRPASETKRSSMVLFNRDHLKVCDVTFLRKKEK